MPNNLPNILARSILFASFCRCWRLRLKEVEQSRAELKLKPGCVWLQRQTMIIQGDSCSHERRSPPRPGSGQRVLGGLLRQVICKLTFRGRVGICQVNNGESSSRWREQHGGKKGQGWLKGVNVSAWPETFLDSLTSFLTLSLSCRDVQGRGGAGRLCANCYPRSPSAPSTPHLLSSGAWPAHLLWASGKCRAACC